MSIFEYLDYRDFLRNELKTRKKNQPGFTQARFAELVGIRNTYLTNVLNGRGNFNSDQIDAIARQLKLTPLQTEYLVHLKEHDQSTDRERKQRLRDRIEQLRAEAKATETHISAKVRRDEHELIMRYYSDPMIKIVHVLAMIPRYGEDLDKIAADLRLTSDRLTAILAILEDLGLIRFVKKKVEVLQRNFHLPKESPMLLPHQILMRNKSAHRLLEVPPDRRYSFSVTFSGDERTRQALQERFLAFLKDAEALVKDSPSESAYQMNFDLFPWTD